MCMVQHLCVDTCPLLAGFLHQNHVGYPSGVTYFSDESNLHQFLHILQDGFFPLWAQLSFLLCDLHGLRVDLQLVTTKVLVNPRDVGCGLGKKSMLFLRN